MMAAILRIWAASATEVPPNLHTKLPMAGL
jgi:hypothetical protein